MTPLEIKVLLHYYTSITPYPKIYAPAVMEAITFFVENGIIDPHNHSITQRGKALIEMLCSVSFPVQKWVDQNDNVIEMIWTQE